MLSSTFISIAERCGRCFVGAVVIALTIAAVLQPTGVYAGLIYLPPTPTGLVGAPPPIPTPPPACVASCTAQHPALRSLVWVSQVINTTITVGTVRIVYDRRRDTTRTTTVLNTLPPGVTPPDLNAAGTRVTTVTISDLLAATNSTTVLAYPTPLATYPYTYLWQGVLPTTAADGSTICATAAGTSTELLPSHPPLGPSASPPAPTLPPGGDARGTNYAPVWAPAAALSPDNGGFDVAAAFPGVAALQVCGRFPATDAQLGPLPQLTTAAFVYETLSFSNQRENCCDWISRSPQ